MKRPLTFGLAFGMAIFASVSPGGAQSQTPDVRWDVLGAQDRAIVDRLAADFYEAGLRDAQADAIESRTAEIYATASPEQRDQFRGDRRTVWRSMGAEEQRLLRSVKRPAFGNLTDEQKAPFRSHTLDRLGGVKALDRQSLADALRRDI